MLCHSMRFRYSKVHSALRLLFIVLSYIGSVAQSDARLPGDQEVVSSWLWSGNILFIEIDHGIFSTIILSLPLIQEGKLSVTCERMCTEYWLTA